MKAFLLAMAAAFLIAAGSSFVLEPFQTWSDAANTTTGARVDFTKDGVEAGQKH